MKRILITGASQGLGQAIAEALDELGHRTVLSARNAEQLDEVARALQGASVLPADLADLDKLPHLVEGARQKMGGLDGLINCAGTIDPIATLQDSDPATFGRAIEVNLTAPALLMKAALPHLRESQGRIVNVSSGAAIKPMPAWGAYCASKAGLLMLTSLVALEAPEVGCFSLRPGVIDTAMQSAIRQSAGMKESDKRRFLDLHEKGGLEPPEVPARAASWLVLEGPLTLNGQLVEYADEAVKAGVRKLFSTEKPEAQESL